MGLVEISSFFLFVQKGRRNSLGVSIAESCKVCIFQGGQFMILVESLKCFYSLISFCAKYEDENSSGMF